METGIIFDVDGTIIDSFEAIYSSLNTVLSGAGIMDFTRDELRDLMDYLSFPEIIGKLAEKYSVDDERMSALSMEYMKHFLNSIKTGMRLFPGIIDVIEYLSKRAVLGIISYNPSFILEEQISQFSLNRYFPYVKGFEDTGGKKRNGINEFSSIYGIDKKRIAFIGDQPKDVIEARAAGVISVAVTYGVSRRETLENESPDYIAENPSQLMEIIRDVFKL